MKLDKMAVAVGRNTMALVFADETENKEYPNDYTCAEAIAKLAPQTLIFVGNRVWATPLASALFASTNIDLRRINKPTEKGVRVNMIKFAGMVLGGNNIGSPFPLNWQDPMPEESHPLRQLALDYLKHTDRVREEKHNILHCLAVLFPECVRPSRPEIVKGRPLPEILPPDIWTKKMAFVRENPDPIALENNPDIPEEVQLLASVSLARHLPNDIRQRFSAMLQTTLKNYANANSDKEIAFSSLKERVINHPLLGIFPDSDSAVVLAGLLGWKKWQWKELIRYCGLNVNRVDSKGKNRISRTHPETRQYLYLLATRTKLGKTWSALPEPENDIETGEPKVMKFKKVKRIYRLLWRLFKFALRENPANLSSDPVWVELNS